MRNTTWSVGDTVFIDESTEVLYTIIHIDGWTAWIRPVEICSEHRHLHHGARCYCVNDALISTNRLWIGTHEGVI